MGSMELENSGPPPPIGWMCNKGQISAWWANGSDLKQHQKRVGLNSVFFLHGYYNQPLFSLPDTTIFNAPKLKLAEDFHQLCECG